MAGVAELDLGFLGFRNALVLRGLLAADFRKLLLDTAHLRVQRQRGRRFFFLFLFVFFFFFFGKAKKKKTFFAQKKKCEGIRHCKLIRMLSEYLAASQCENAMKGKNNHAQVIREKKI